MTTSVLLYAAGALLEGWLAVMLTISGRALRGGDRRWTGWLAAGFGCNAIRSALLSLGYGNVSLAARPNALTATLASVALALMTVALMDYVELGPPAKRRIWRVGGPLLVGLWLVATLGWLPRGAAALSASVFFFGWAALFVRAARREPHSGHVLVVLAILTFPATVAALMLGLLPLQLLPVSEIVPLAAIGIAVLTTGLVRAQQRALRAGERMALALVARERAESELRAINETLELRVGQRTANLQETIDGLESFNQSVSHDLRGPLGGIAGVARLARDEVAAGRTEAADRMLRAIEKQADHSMAMIAALLALARAANTQPRRTQVHTGEMVEEIVAALAGTQPASPQIVVQPLPDADADPQLLRQVFANLLGNACKFAGAANEARIEVGHAQTPNGGAYFVRDNGVGFSNLDAQRMFQPFQRLHGAGYDGFGVGLSIVRRIVDHHGGQVWADGVPGGGATFWFTLGGR